MILLGTGPISWKLKCRKLSDEGFPLPCTVFRAENPNAAIDNGSVRLPACGWRWGGGTDGPTSTSVLKVRGNDSAHLLHFSSFIYFRNVFRRHGHGYPGREQWQRMRRRQSRPHFVFIVFKLHPGSHSIWKTTEMTTNARSGKVKPIR